MLKKSINKSLYNMIKEILQKIGRLDIYTNFMHALEERVWYKANNTPMWQKEKILSFWKGYFHELLNQGKPMKEEDIDHTENLDPQIFKDGEKTWDPSY